MKARRFLTLGLLILVLAFAPVFSPYPVRAATTWVVNDLGDGPNVNCNPGMCTLRGAIKYAASGDTITFSKTGTINLNQGTLVLDKNLTISGPGADKLSINGVASRVFHIAAGRTVTLSGLTITHGTSSNGGGIYNEGVLTLNQCTVSDHRASGDGGGLYNKGKATVNRSTFIDNQANYGAGIKNEGGVLNVINSTFTRNHANARGGGIDSGSASILNVTNSTFRDNSAATGGGIANPSSVTTARNVLMAGNMGWNCDPGKFATGSTNNLTTDAFCSPGFKQVSPAQLALGVLTGNPAYFPLKVGSAAIDAGTNTGCPTIDEPGKTRPQDGDGNGSAICDIGSWEYMGPPPPANVQASDGTYTDKVRVSWNASGGATSYNVYRAISSTGTKTLAGNTADTTYDDKDVPAGPTYYYWVKACDGAYCFAFSASNSGWRSLVAVPVSVQASQGTYTDKVQVSWDPSGGATSYKVYRAATATGTKALLGSPIAKLLDNTFNDTTAIPGVTYTYWVRAYKGTGFSDYSDPVTGWRKLSPPANVRASDGTYTNKVLVSWAASSGATSYQVYRATAEAGTQTLLGSPTVTTFNDLTATPGVTYYYWVVAYRGAVFSDLSVFNTGWRKPLPPANVQASDGTYTDKVRVSWNASIGATSYNVFRAASSTGTKTLLGNPAETTFDDPVGAGPTYYYWVTACNGSNCSTFSASNSGWRSVVPVPVNVQASQGTDIKEVVVSWDPSDGATSYKVYRAATASGTKALLGSPIAKPLDNAFNDLTAIPGVTYTYWVRAYKGTGFSDYSDPVTGWRKLSPPANVQASDGTYTNKVLVSWAASSGATSYKVYRATGEAGTQTLLGSPTVTTFSDLTATPGVTYYYWVAAYRGANSSDLSAYNTGWRKPLPPANVQASDGTYTDKVQVSWNASSGVTSYQVYRATSSTGTKDSLDPPALGTTFDDTSVTAGPTYYYWVKACNETNCSAFSVYNTGWRKP